MPKRVISRVQIWPLGAALLTIVLHQLYLERTASTDWYSFVSEGAIALALVFIIGFLQTLRHQPKVFQTLYTGFFLLFYAILTDTLDELYKQPLFITAVCEDLFKVLGYVLIACGIKFWSDSQNLHAQQMYKLATTDELTQISTRRHFLQLAEREFERHRRNGLGMAVIMFDLDHFKQVNDCFGHSGGDEALKQFSATMRRSIRQNDILARWGGEEFIAVLVDSDTGTTKQIAERIKRTTEQLSIPYKQQMIQITTSAGVATLQNDDENIKQLIDRADQLLYRAKQTGRNRVCYET